MDYKSLEFCLNKFKKLKLLTIGRSEDDRNIYSLTAFFAASRPWVIIQSSIHAREHLSSDLCIMLAHMVENNFENYMEDYPNICFIPMSNPDGVEITFKGIKAINNSELKKRLDILLHDKDYRLFKANARGVDLNNNFDAMWNKHKGISQPSFHGYKGEYPFSERETIVLATITKTLKPSLTISLHTKGEEIYYDFYQTDERRKRDKCVAQKVASINGYQIKSTEHCSFGGYKDWCVQDLKIPALTIELGRDEYNHPVRSQEIYEIISKNSGIIDNLCDIVKLCKEN